MTNSLRHKIATNFYTRNAFIFLCYLLLFFFLIQILNAGRSDDKRQLAFILLYFSFVFGWVLFHNRVLIDRILLRKKPFWYIFFLMPGMALWFLLAWLFDPFMKYTFSMVGEVLTFIFFTTIGTLFFLSAKYFWEKKELYQLSSLKRDIELQQLKTQLKPHFLFNALNNIYGYTLFSEKFGNVLILKLSELMRYILDTSEINSVRVSEEVRFIENYISFEKERLGERCNIVFSKEVCHPNREIAPLILFPFIENAFKYGSDTIQKTTVEIGVVDTATSLRLIVKNSIINENIPSTKKGISITNRRLELVYPGKYSLQLENKDKMFVADLTIVYAKD